MEKRVISILVDNHPGVLSRVASLFARRSLNIDDLSVGTTETENLTRITVTLKCDTATYTQVVRQISKLLCVRKVMVLSDHQVVKRQTVLCKIKADPSSRVLATTLAQSHGATVVGISQNDITVEMTGEEEYIRTALLAFSEFGIVELSKTGFAALCKEGEIMSINVAANF